jgi:hypothetical protein
VFWGTQLNKSGAFFSAEEQERKKVIKLNFMSIRIGIKIKKLLRSFLFFHKMLSTDFRSKKRL